MLLAGLSMAAGSALLLPGGNVLTRILALLGLVAAAGYAFYPAATRREGSGGVLGVGVVLFFCYWLVVFYKENSGDPVLWNYAVETLALASATLAFYYVVGYLYYRAKPLRTIYSALLAVFFCMTALGGDLDLGISLILAGTALALLTLAGVLILNMKPLAAAGGAEEVRRRPDAFS